MKYLSFKTPSGRAAAGALIDGRVAALTFGSPDSVPSVSPIRQFIAAHLGDLPTRVDDLAILEAYDLADIEILPVVPDPTKIAAAPVNYLDHKAEMSQDAHIDALGVFLKAPSSLLAHGRAVQLPYEDRRFDQEGELAFVIGRTARNVSAGSAPSYIAGYTCLLDMTMRGGEDRSTRKSFDTFTPAGPHLVTPDEVGELADLRLQTRVNDELRQDADVNDLIWGVPALLSYVSSVMTLHPGDIVTTGTPAGVGQVEDGDRVTVELSRIGRLEVTITAAGATVCPTLGANRGPKPPETVTPVRAR